jgi:hypothetical protein
MGFTIPGPTRGKAEHLIRMHNAERLPSAPRAFHQIPAGRALICVIHTYMDETAFYCFSALELAVHDDPSDFRKREWVLIDKTKAEELSNFPKPPTGEED